LVICNNAIFQTWAMSFHLACIRWHRHLHHKWNPWRGFLPIPRKLNASL
jgi:hypothetical protein